MAPVPNSFFATDHRRRELEQALHGVPPGPESLTGTVGAVALDAHGNSLRPLTGGLTAKRWGRVGDSPIIGAGTCAATTCRVATVTGSTSSA